VETPMSLFTTQTRGAKARYGSAALAIAALAALALNLGEPSYARPADEAAFLGTANTEGRYNNLRKTAATITVTKDSEGKLSIRREARYTAAARRNDPAFTWTSGDVTYEGGELKVVYRIATDGTSLDLDGDSLGLTARIEGQEGNATAADGTTYTDDDVNVFEAVYRYDDDGTYREEVKNTTRKAPEEWWRKIATKGISFSGPRIKLGGEQGVVAGRGYPVVVPTDGTLELSISSGAFELRDPAGNVAAVSSGGRIEWDVPHENPVLGVYTAQITSASDGSVVKARFKQLGKIDARIRPWSSHTYYPIYEENWGGAENDRTMFCSDGPLAKFDQLLGLSGKESAVWWEKGGDYRTGFGFEHGHYTKVQSPKEAHAEDHWNADLDGDGFITRGDVASVVSRYDADADGKITKDEAKAVYHAGAIQVLFARYDGDQSGGVDAGEISATFVSRYDENSDDKVDMDEWKKALEADFAQVVDGVATPNLDKFLAKDADGDGVIVLAEMGQPGALDFNDSSDVDGDFDNFFDRNNIKIVTKDDAVHFGNKVVEEDGKLKLMKGRKSDELVVELDPADVKEREDGIADGDLDDSYSVGWWGHCNAWAMASIVFRKPAGEFEQDGVTLSVRDQKGMLVEYGMGDTEDSSFWWQQWGGDDIPHVKYTAGFHRQLHRWLRVEQKGMMADMDMKDPHNNLNFQVWNYPLLGYTATLSEAEGGDPYVLDVRCTLEKGSYSDEDSSSTASVKYRLHFTEDGSIREDDEAKTSWEQKNSSDKREYIRYLIHPYRFIESSRGSRNPNVTLKRLETLFGERLKYNRLEDLEAEDANAGGLSGTEPGTDD